MGMRIAGQGATVANEILAFHGATRRRQLF